MATDEEKKPLSEEEVDPRTRAQARKALHEKKEKERKAKSEQLKGDYMSIKDAPALEDILAKARSFAAYHSKLAEDGVGARNVGKDESGAPIVEDYYLTDSQVARELGGASALKQLITYIENQLS
ncbi:hypothetical protein KDA23_07920 [Candidatus Saccharibacteria bacterium]|nr:hypothetical protein [Candidatus Saccharibacteria bacterium]